SPLPQPRKKPLQPGGAKESELISYLDHTIRNVKGRWAKRMFKDEEVEQGEAHGYHSFGEAAHDIDGLVDVVWVSGSPNLQVPYLLSIALLMTDFLPDFPPAPQATFRVLDKLDHAFSSLLQGKDSDTGEPLPGFESGRNISTTDKVRLKSIVERTRLIVVEALSGESREEESMDIDDEFRAEASETELSKSESENDDTVKFEGFDDFDSDEEDDDDREELHIAKVYERTIGELGDVLGGPPIGIITDD
ncbi:hypothetical protein BDV96DRAFT_468914, partial [Lophiotrema nucula]